MRRNYFKLWDLVSGRVLLCRNIQNSTIQEWTARVYNSVQLPYGLWCLAIDLGHFMEVGKILFATFWLYSDWEKLVGCRIHTTSYFYLESLCTQSSNMAWILVFKVQPIIHEYDKNYIPFWDKNATLKLMNFICNPIHCLLETFTGQWV